MTARQRMYAVALVFLLALSSFAAPPGRRRAVLIGINDYSASTLPASRNSDSPKRDWANLDGAVNDVSLIREILIARYAFAPADIVMLVDQQATRSAVMGAIDKHLLRPARRDDVLFFYYSGHGSQVRNSLSSELDKLDESLVPADSRRGARDIRDKELAVVFNQLLDRGARLTVVLDACHSASGARGLSGGLRHRGVKPDPRDAADATHVPRPEDRGALVMSAAEDFDLAYETLAEDTIRGAFSWALSRALRDADPGEAASDTFLRAVARLRAETPAQNPVLAGRTDARLASFLSASDGRPSIGHSIAVENVWPDGTCALLGGWVHGLTVGTRLRLVAGGGPELEVTALIGAGRASARILRTGTSRTATRTAVRPGALLETSKWAAPALRKLRVWIPRGTDGVVQEGRNLAEAAVTHGTHSIDDPTETTPSDVIRWRGNAWEKIPASGERGTAVFVQIPATAAIADAAGGVAGIELVSGPETAEYILTGRATRTDIEYAWVRPGVTASDSERSAMPLRSGWVSASAGDKAARALRTALLRLVHIHAWHALQSPAGSGSPYRLALKDARDGSLVEKGPLEGKRAYQLVLRIRQRRPVVPLYPRYVYAFVIDSRGRAILLFPRPATGSVENRLPLEQSASLPIEHPPEEIPLGDGPTFIVADPYGMDTYFLLSTDEPLSSTSCLEWDGVRSPSAAPRTPLELLLAQTSGTRGQESVQTSPNWSIEKVVFESIPPRRASR